MTFCFLPKRIMLNFFNFEFQGPVSEPAALPLLRANLGAHIRSVLAAVRPLSVMSHAQQLQQPHSTVCRQLAEAAAGVAVASRLLLSRSISSDSALPNLQQPPNGGVNTFKRTGASPVPVQINVTPTTNSATSK